MKKNMHTAHDRFFKKALSNIKIAQEFFENHLPATFLKHIDLSTLIVEKGSFIDTTLREHLSDMLYKVKIGDREGYIYILLEAQSTPDELMAFRLLEYQVQIMRRHIDQQPKKGRALPLIMPLVFYTGTRSADGFKRDIMDCFFQPELARHYFMQPFNLVSMTDTPDDEIMKGKLTSAIELIQKHIQARDISLYLEELMNSGALLKLYRLDGNLVTSMLQYIAEKGQIKEPETLVEKLVKHLPGEEKEMATIAQHFEQQKAKNIARNLLAMGTLDAASIAQATEMTVDEVKSLKPKSH